MSQENVEIVRNRLEGCWKRDSFEPLDYIDAGGRFVLVEVRFVTAVTGLIIWLVFRVDAGKIVDWHSFATEGEARRASKTGWSGPPHAPVF
jgi:hypothetical protein